MASSSSEDVLQIVPKVWHKKSEGNLYLMGERIAWMAVSKSTFQISHNYTDIKLQKISPDTKDKVQLQLVMHNGEANTFHFRNSEGRNACIRDREKVKELLQRLLPQFRNKINSELEIKHKMLQENKQLFQLYNDLVVSGVISAEDFWTNRAQLTKEKLAKQDVGVSPAFLSEIKPQSAGANSLSYNLTTDMIESIFRTYPQVKSKHLEFVPHQMTENEFWTKFFQSHYFHRDRITTGNKDLFTDCAKQDEKEMEEELQGNTCGDEFVNLCEMTDCTMGEGFEDGTTEHKASSSSTNLTIIKRFNHHSARIIKTAVQRRQVDVSENSGPKGDGVSSLSSPHSRKRKLEEATNMENLCAETDSNRSTLTLARIDRYFNGPVPQTNVRYRSTEQMLMAANSLVHEVEQWSDQTKVSLTPSTARAILTELSPGGALMYGVSQQSMADMVPNDIKTELRHLYCAVNELLRHFWACFPTHSKQLEDKLVKMEQNLQRFKAGKLQPFKERIQPYSFSFNLTDHIENQLLTAFERYQKWHSRKIHKSSSTPTLMGS